MGVVAFVAFAWPTPARGDSATAMDELKAGYALKREGHCADAIPHFVASFRADPKPKALLNEADCEEQTNDLLAALEHAIQGLKLARDDHDSELTTVATSQLARLDSKLPRLALRVPSDFPAEGSLLLDDRALSLALAAGPMALNPGSHRIVARASGRTDSVTELELKEGDHRIVEVKIGPALAPTSQRDPLMVSRQNLPAEKPGVNSAGMDPTPDNARQVLTYSVLGTGAAGLAVGIAIGLVAVGKHNALDQECTAGCPASAQGDINSFRSLRTWSTFGYVIGLLGLSGGAALWLTAPRGRSSGAHVEVGPRSLGVSGAF
jgi:hypothetical protein